MPFGLRGEILRHCAQVFQVAAIQPLHGAPHAVRTGFGGGIELLALISGQVEFQLPARLLARFRRLQLNGHQRSHFVQRSGKELRNTAQRFEILTRAAHRASAAHELHADRLADLLRAAQQDRADLSGSAYVSASAGAAVQPIDRHDAQHALAPGGFAQSLRFARVFEPDVHRAILRHQLVGAPFGFEHRAGARRVRLPDRWWRFRRRGGNLPCAG